MKQTFETNVSNLAAANAATAMENRPRHPGARDTREKILEVASGMFADKGYRGTTVAEICRRAGANIAAVNYHFGGKESLYQEAWRHAHERQIRRFPPDGGVRADARAELRLRGRIKAILQRVLSGDGIEFRIMRNETASPTGLLGQVIQDSVGPLRQALREILRDLLGRRADERTIELCALSVIGPTMQILRRQVVPRHEGHPLLFTESMIEDMAEHFTAFNLAGIRMARRRIERRREA